MSPAPRTHEDMRKQMRSRLLEATAHVLIEQGYAKTSVQAICDRAGVTKGALFRHYESRAALMAAAANNIFTGLVARFGNRFADMRPGPDFAARTIGLLREHMQDPLMHAAHELRTAARTDAVLRSSLAPVMADYKSSARQMAGLLFPNARRANPQFMAVVELIISALDDDTRCEQVLPDTPHERDLRDMRLAVLARLAETEVLTHEPQLLMAEGPVD